MRKYIRKADYIAMYGEEAWIAHTAKKNEYNKQYREANKDSIAEYYKQYYDTNKEHYAEYRKDSKEHIAEYMKQYRQEHKEEKKEYNKQRYQDNKEYFAEYNKQYRQEHVEECKEYNRRYRSTQRGRAKNLKLKYVQFDKEKGFSTDKNIDEEWIIENIFGSQCIYCGESNWAKLGADRKDNTKGHTPDNCVCSCKKCNELRGDKFTVEEFIQYRKLHPREQPIPDTDDKVINAWKGRFKISSNRINF